MRRWALVNGLAAAMMPLVAGAQAPLPVHPERIKPYVTMWRVTVTRPDGSKIPQGLWTDQVVFTLYKGRDAIRRVQGITYVNGQTFTWVNVLDAKTLRPLMHVEHAPKGEIFTRDFGDDTVTTHHTAADGTALDSSRTPLTGAVYDYLAGTFGMLLETLPLTDGYSATFRSIDGYTDSVKTLQATVTGREATSAGGGRTVEAWKVREGQYTFFIADEAPYVLKLVEVLPSGLTVSWELM